MASPLKRGIGKYKGEGDFSMKNPILKKGSYGAPIQKNYKSSVLKDKPPFSKYGEMFKAPTFDEPEKQMFTSKNVGEPTKKPTFETSKIGKSIKAFLGGLKSDVSKVGKKIKKGFHVGGDPSKKLRITESLQKTTGDIQKTIHKATSKVGGEVKKIKSDIEKKFPGSKKHKGKRKVLKNPFNPHGGWKWVDK